jgi:hypothetical protein
MDPVESILPRVLAVVLLIVSLLMVATIAYFTLVIVRGGAVPPRAWVFPLIILAIGSVLMWLLTRRQLSFRLYMAAFTLWLLTTGYYFVNFAAMLSR